MNKDGPLGPIYLFLVCDLQPAAPELNPFMFQA